MQVNIKMDSVGMLNDFFADRKILVLEGHEWAGEKTDFIEMVNADGKVANPADKPSEQLLMKVKTRFGTDLLLEGKYVFIIEKQIVQRPNQN